MYTDDRWGVRPWIKESWVNDLQQHSTFYPLVVWLGSLQGWIRMHDHLQRHRQEKPQEESLIWKKDVEWIVIVNDVDDGGWICEMKRDDACYVYDVNQEEWCFF